MSSPRIDTPTTHQETLAGAALSPDPLVPPSLQPPWTMELQQSVEKSVSHVVQVATTIVQTVQQTSHLSSSDISHGEPAMLGDEDLADDEHEADEDEDDSEDSTAHLSIDDYGFYYPATSASPQSEQGSSLSKSATVSSQHRTQVIHDLQTYRRIESKWIQILNEWHKYSEEQKRKLRSFCRRGIPDSVRAKAWQMLAETNRLQRDNVYDVCDWNYDGKWILMAFIVIGITQKARVTDL